MYFCIPEKKGIKKAAPDINPGQPQCIWVDYKFTFTIGEKIMSSTPETFKPIRANT